MAVYDLSPTQLRALISYNKNQKINSTMMTTRALWRRGYVEPKSLNSVPTKPAEFKISPFGRFTLNRIKTMTK